MKDIKEPKIMYFKLLVDEEAVIKELPNRKDFILVIHIDGQDYFINRVQSVAYDIDVEPESVITIVRRQAPIIEYINKNILKKHLTNKS